MIQRYLLSALAAGLSAAKQDQRIVDDLFVRNYGLGQSEADAIYKYLKDRTPTVKHGFPNNETTWPAFCITLGNEQEAISFVGNEAAPILDPDDVDYGNDFFSTVWAHRFDVFIFTENPETTAYLYELGKAILLASTEFFNSKGLMDISISGSDLAPDPRYMPEHVIVRRLVFNAQREFTRLNLDAGLTKITKIDGIHVQGGSFSDVGDVQTLVTTFLEDAEDE